MTMQTIAVACHAGGVGKTTTTHYLARAFGTDARVLTIDLDPQASLTARYKMGAMHSIGDALAGRSPLRKCIEDVYNQDGPFFGCVPATLRLQETAAWLQSQPVTHDHLSLALRDVEGLADIVLIDCPPSADLLTINALVAADIVIVPVIPEAKGLAGINRMVELVNWLNTRRLSKARIAGMIATQIDWRTTAHVEMIDQLRAHAVPLLGEVRNAKGQDADERLREMYGPIADNVAINDLLRSTPDVEYAPC